MTTRSLRLFDANGTLIDTLAVPITTDGGIDQLLVDVAGVSRMEIELAFLTLYRLRHDTTPI